LTKIANLSPEITKSGVPGKDRTLPLKRIFSVFITLRTRSSTPVLLVPIPRMRSETAFDFDAGRELTIQSFLHTHAESVDVSMWQALMTKKCEH